MSLRWYASRYTGLFRELAAMPLRPHDPPVSMWAGTPLGRTDGVGGAAWDDDAAELAAVGEAIERHQMHAIPSDKRIRARAADLAGATTGFALFSDEQYALPGFPFHRFDPAEPHDWLAFRRVTDGERRYVPLELATSDLRPGAVHRLQPAISTGWSAHTDLAVAIRRGIQEVIERDAITCAWWGAYPVEEHDADAIVDPRARRPNLTYRCFRIASPWSANVTMTTVEGEDKEGWCFAIGSACRDSREASWAKSLLEAIQGRAYVRYLRTKYKAPIASPHDFAEHAVGYSLDRARLAQTIFARPSPSPSPISPSPPDALFRLHTPPELVATGWCVVRVICPGLQPLHGDHALPFLGGPGWRGRTLADHRAIPPHPFA